MYFNTSSTCEASTELAVPFVQAPSIAWLRQCIGRQNTCAEAGAYNALGSLAGCWQVCILALHCKGACGRAQQDLPAHAAPRCPAHSTAQRQRQAGTHAEKVHSHTAEAHA